MGHFKPENGYLQNFKIFHNERDQNANESYINVCSKNQKTNKQTNKQKKTKGRLRKVG